VKLLKKTIARQKLEKKQRLTMFGGMLQGGEEGEGEVGKEGNVGKEGGGKGGKRRSKVPSLYADKKDVQPSTAREQSEEDNSITGLINENWMFLVSVVFLVVALVLKYQYL